MKFTEELNRPLCLKLGQIVGDHVVALIERRGPHVTYTLLDNRWYNRACAWLLRICERHGVDAERIIKQ